MWDKIESLTKDHPERTETAKTILQNGLAIRGERIYLNQIEVPVLRVARAAGVDRRTVMETVRMINNNPEIKSIFSNLESAGFSLRKVARFLGLGVVEITADDPHKVGILAGAARLLAEAGINVRQALVGDPDIEPDPKLVLIAQNKIPGSVIQEMLKINGIAKVTVY
jgi:uncharacterized protein